MRGGPCVLQHRLDASSFSNTASAGGFGEREEHFVSSPRHWLAVGERKAPVIINTRNTLALLVSWGGVWGGEMELRVEGKEKGKEGRRKREKSEEKSEEKNGMKKRLKGRNGKEEKE